MFRIWGKIFKDNHLVRDMVYENGDTDINRTKKVFAGIHVFAEAFDLQQPIWLDKNINEFKRVDKTRFEQDNFIEQIDFDYLEIEVIEEQQKNSKTKFQRGKMFSH